MSQRTEETHGRNFKYDGTQEETGRLLRRFCPAWKTESLELFRRHLFNYLTGNGDAHLKNFSLLQGPQGEFFLSPAYDLLMTSIHLPNESRCALAMFDEAETKFFKDNAFYGREDFLLLAEKFHMPASLAERELNRIISGEAQIRKLVNHSFLGNDARTRYLDLVADRRRALSGS